jgi:acetoacetate decarboxylase
MLYKQPSGMLTGDAVMSIHPVDTRAARSLVPDPLLMVSVLPGKTLGMIYLARYGGALRHYHELVVAPALVSIGRKTGFLIAGVAVDNPDVSACSKEFRGLRKNIAEFDWEPGTKGEIRVTDGGLLLCSFQGASPRHFGYLHKAIPFITNHDGGWVMLREEFLARTGVAVGRVDIPAGSPFAVPGMGRTGAAFHLHGLQLSVSDPEMVEAALKECVPQVQ